MAGCDVHCCELWPLFKTSIHFTILYAIKLLDFFSYNFLDDKLNTIAIYNIIVRQKYYPLKVSYVI